MADKLLSKCAHPRTAEARAKMSVAHMGNKNALGHHCSEEARAKMSEARKGIPAWNKGVSPSEEVRAKMGLSLKGVPLSAETRAKMSAAAKGKTKSAETRKRMSIVHRGALGSNWRGGVTPENDLVRRSVAYATWRTAVFERDNYTCQDCGQHGGELNAHHINPFAEFTDLRLDVDNGKTLCVKCHNKTKGKTKMVDYLFIPPEVKHGDSYLYN